MNWLKLNDKERGAINAAHASSDLSHPDVAVGHLQSVQQSVPGYRPDLLMPVSRPNRSFHAQDVQVYRYDDPDTLLLQLSKMDPDVSAGIWNFLRLLDSGFRATALDRRLVPDPKLQLRLDQMLLRLAGMNDFETWAVRADIGQVVNQMAKYVLLRGATALELVLGQDRRLQRFVVVDPVTVMFRQPKPGVFAPYQLDWAGQQVDMSIPTFFWSLLDADASSPFETPPFLPAIQAVLFNLSVLQDLQRIVKRTAFPRIKVKIIEQTLRKFAPPQAQMDPKEMARWLNEQRASIGAALRDLKPEDAAVFFDSTELGMLETQSNATVDYSPLIKVIDQRVITGLKSLPTILGRQFGSSQTLGGVESLLYAKGVCSVQAVVCTQMSRALTLALRLEGGRGFVRCRYGAVTLRPDHELESYRILQQNRVLQNLSLGLITDSQAAEELTGDPTLPDTFVSLSGTGFWKQDAAAIAAAQANIATRDPAGAEATGAGRTKR